MGWSRRLDRTINPGGSHDRSVSREVLLLKETPSLGDAVQELLEAIGDHVESAGSAEEAVSGVQIPSRFDLVVSACNRRPSSLLRLLGKAPPSKVRLLPVVVVGDPLGETHVPALWPIHKVPLPLVPENFVSLLSRVAPGRVREAATAGPCILPSKGAHSPVRPMG